MATNVVCKSKVERRYNAKIMGSNKRTYVPYTANLAGTDEDYSDGKLQQATVIHINYDVTGKFPDDKFAEALTPSTTELAQAHAKEVEFSYHRQPTHIEFRLSSMQNVNDVNINAGLLNRLLMQYDYEHFHGKHGNSGMMQNKNAIEYDETVVTISDISGVLTVINAIYEEQAKALGLGEADHVNMTLSYTSDIAAIMRKPITSSGGDVVTGKSAVQRAYENVKMLEVPSILGTSSHISLTYRPAVNNHHGSVPGIYSKESGDHGLVQKSLFTYESAANELEAKGSYVYQLTETAASRALKERAKEANK
ncbi:hypothetical protein AKH15_08605 [Vibrio parahaemolyticus]|uniref:hypothetical protein n=1 Tax=Vibrio harveyi group TaxID=717610 RepID=UPI000813CEC7|nr:hypothetical protein [Vibrio parahaemolyticus]EGQ7651866.1 hypothetical protein [Vibrio parahaemolyticus]EGQ8515723.1 hypothetical protein [Vibrio parahaemolyticus]EHH1060814.1 hypothetical protein [Vibrio parahaemolyticus]EJG1825267.1 hypothetical protein [Vibrio parahaemolyticus]ELA9593311.1 hypothetical protein [Vibrio parahaemolyticus]